MRMIIHKHINGDMMQTSRSSRVVILLTEQEKAGLTAQAKASHRSVGELIRQRALSDDEFSPTAESVLNQIEALLAKLQHIIRQNAD